MDMKQIRLVRIVCVIRRSQTGSGATFSDDMEYPEVNVYGSNVFISPGGSLCNITLLMLE